MAQMIRLLRGRSVNLPLVVLAEGEPLFTSDDGKFYIGGEGGVKWLINPNVNVGVTTVNERSGNVILTAKDVNLERAENTSDIEKNVLTAQSWLTARTLTFNGDASGSVSVKGNTDMAATLTLANIVTPATYPKITFNAKGQVTGGSGLLASDIPALTLSKISDAGTAAGRNVGTGANNIPILDDYGKLAESVLPSIAIVETFEASSQAEMLALAADRGDICIRTDLPATFILSQSPASILANWRELKTPTSAVQSVNGMVGTVIVTTITGNAGTATALQNARTINGVSFNGTANITIYDSSKEPVLPSGSTTEQYLQGGATRTWADLMTGVRATTLTGLASSETEFTAADTILVAFGKAMGRINSKAPISHAVNAATYGEASSANWGHVRLSSTLDATTGDITNGVALENKYLGVSQAVNLNTATYGYPGEWTFYNVSTATGFPTGETWTGTGNSSYLKVIRFYSTTAHVQMLWKRATNRMWIRVKTTATENSTWVELLKTDSVIDGGTF